MPLGLSWHIGYHDRLFLRHFSHFKAFKDNLVMAYTVTANKVTDAFGELPVADTVTAHKVVFYVVMAYVDMDTFGEASLLWHISYGMIVMA